MFQCFNVDLLELSKQNCNQLKQNERPQPAMDGEVRVGKEPGQKRKVGLWESGFSGASWGLVRSFLAVMDNS